MKAKFTLEGRLAGKYFIVPSRKGKFIEPPEGAPAYYVRFTDKDGRRTRKALGTNFSAACAEVANMEIAREYIRRGVTPPGEIAQLEDSLANRIAEYLEEKKAERAHKSWLAYSNSLVHFQASCNAVHPNGVKRHDLLKFKTYLREDAKLAPRSVYNNFLNVMIFFKWCGTKFDPPITKEDWPPKPQREPEEYSDEQIETMLTTANPEERLVLNSFLATGLRSGELAHLTYGDIDFKYSVWTVQPKAEWQTKTEESQRDVPAPDWLTKKIKERMEARGARPTDRIFPNRNMGPDIHLLRIVKRVAKRANLTGRVDDHKFRSTAITRWLRGGKTVPEVMKFVGHVDPDTMLRYAAKGNVRDPEVHRKATAPFDRFQGVGD